MSNEHCKFDTYSDESCISGNRGKYWTVIRFIVATVILTATVLKAHQLATTPSLGDGLLHARWFNIFVVEFELFFGMWLIWGLFPKPSWLLSVICFITFAAVAWFKFFAGENSCGCFGRVNVPPLYTAMFDLAVVGMLVVFRPEVKWFGGRVNVKYHLVNYMMFVVPLGCFVLWQVSIAKTDQLQEVGQVLYRGSIVQLEPKVWIDKEFPLRDYCDVGEELVIGHWLVLLYRTGCTECLEAESFVLKFCKSESCRIAVLKMNDDDVNPEFRNFDFVSGFLNREIVWFAETPIILELENGTVKHVWFRRDLKQI
jgi:uncharacterized membrane protein YphA (DoxX/SURF4 family)